jgi:hypothetical protein
VHSGNLAHTRTHNLGLRNLKKQEWRERVRARNHYTSERFLMECVQKTCCVTASAALPENSFLELAKGFEPLTL